MDGCASIKDLCSSILKSRAEADKFNEIEKNAIIKRLYLKSYNILLFGNVKKKLNRDLLCLSNVRTAYLYYQLTLALKEEWDKVNKLDELLKQLDIGKNENILKLLLLLRNKNICNIVREKDNVFLPELDKTSSRSLQARPTFIDFRIPDLYSLDVLDEAYTDKRLLQFSFKAIPSTCPLILAQLPALSVEKYSSFKFDKVDLQKSIFQLNDVEKVKPLVKKKENIWDTLLKKDSEYLSDLTKTYKKFSWDIDEAWLVFGALEQKKSDKELEELLDKFDATSIDSKNFISHSKYVLVGLPSTSFIWCEVEKQFKVKEGLHVKGIISEFVKKLCDQLLEAGTIFKCLYSLFLSVHKQIKHGFIYRDLCFKLPDFFDYYRQRVFSIDDNSLWDFYSEFQELNEIIQCVARCFCIKINENASEERLQGIELLNNMYQEILTVNKNRYLFAINYFLFNCYDIYFRRFIGPWLFDGAINDPYDEFFIKVNQNFSYCRDRKYWRHAYTINSAIQLPPFLDKCRDAILLCGKTVLLNKHFTATLKKSQSSLGNFTVPNQPIEMNICRNKEELDELKLLCEKYSEEGINRSGLVMSFEDIFQLESEKAKNLQLNVPEKQMQTLSKIKLKMQQDRQQKFLRKQEKIKEYYDERKPYQLANDFIKSKQIRDELIQFNKDKEKKKEEADKLEFEKQELYKYYMNLNNELELKQKLVTNRSELLEKYLNKTVLTLPLHTSQNKQSLLITEQETPKIENMALTPTNRNAAALPVADSTTTISKIQPIDNFFVIPNHNMLQFELINSKLNSNLDIESVDTETLSAGEIDECTVITPAKNNQFAILDQLEKNKENIKSPNKNNLIENLNAESASLESETKIINNEIEDNKELVQIYNDLEENPYLDKKYINATFKLNFEILNVTPREKTDPISEYHFLTLPFDSIEDRIKYIWNEKKESSSNKKSVNTIENKFEKEWSTYTIVTSKLFDLNMVQSLMLPLNAQMKLQNTNLITCLINDFKLFTHFRTISNYFFFFESEYEHNFTRRLFPLLYQASYPKEVFNFKVLHDIISYATQSSNNSEFFDRVSLNLINVPSVLNLESSQLLNCLVLTYRVKWPLNVIFSDNILNEYNKIFQYLLSLKRVQWVLNDIFNILKFTQKQMNFEWKLLTKSQHYTKIHAMRHIMNTWLTSLLSHVTESVLHSACYQFEKDLLKVQTMDQIYSTHKQFIRDAVFRCSLNTNSSMFIEQLNRTFELIYQFHNLFRNRQFIIKDRDYIHPNFYKLKLCFSNFKKIVQFIIKLCEKQVKTDYQPHLEKFLIVVNINDFFD